MTVEPSPSLKLVVAWSDRRNLCSLVEDALITIAGDEVRRLDENSCLVYTSQPASSIRDRVSEALNDAESVFAAEFETWSGYGPGIDAAWLRARGH